jgi:hypothetical protein
MFKHKKIILILLILSVSSCGGTMDSVKRGLTGEKQNNADEFLIKKKDPLIFPPNLDELPTPNEQTVAVQQSTVIEKQSDLLVDESENASSSSIEKSILRKIKTR